MRQKLINNIKRFFEHNAVVLMYHRIAQPESDVWQITVSPQNFEQHLQVLKKMGNVISLQEMVVGLGLKKLPKNSIAISFDDGYIDNLETAKPLLEKYNLPATFFITSMNIGSQHEFWWDELEYLILFSTQLPALFSLVINAELLEIKLGEEICANEMLLEKHRNWDACTQEPPSIRATLFYKIWQQLRSLPTTEQQHYLQEIRTWAGSPLSPRPGYRTMSDKELKQLAAGKLFTIGAHTVSHPALAYFPGSFQKKELLNNQVLLRQITGKEVSLLSYPYGNYNDETIGIAAASGFSAAFTTEEESVKLTSSTYRLGRFQVKNITGAQLQQQLKQWRLQ